MITALYSRDTMTFTFFGHHIIPSNSSPHQVNFNVYLPAQAWNVRRHKTVLRVSSITTSAKVTKSVQQDKNAVCNLVVVSNAKQPYNSRMISYFQ